MKKSERERVLKRRLSFSLALSVEERSLIATAAKADGKSVGQFIRDVAIAAAGAAQK
jgi:uncharacterized protein (DUF1778 family)